MKKQLQTAGLKMVFISVSMVLKLLQTFLAAIYCKSVMLMAIQRVRAMNVYVILIRSVMLVKFVADAPIVLDHALELSQIISCNNDEYSINTEPENKCCAHQLFYWYYC